MSVGSSINACTIPVSLAIDVLKGLEMSFKKYLAHVQRANIQSYIDTLGTQSCFSKKSYSIAHTSTNLHCLPVIEEERSLISPFPFHPVNFCFGF